MHHRNSRLNYIYHSMIRRCYDSKSDNYKHYGGKGVTVCEEWLCNERVIGKRLVTKGWLSFKEWALSNGYRDDLTIDRIDNNKGYLPDNCRWVTPKEQSRNRRSNKLITFKGKSQLLSDWCKELGLKKTTVSMRINAYGWSIEKALETPGRKST